MMQVLERTGGSSKLKKGLGRGYQGGVDMGKEGLDG